MYSSAILLEALHYFGGKINYVPTPVYNEFWDRVGCKRLHPKHPSNPGKRKMALWTVFVEGFKLGQSLSPRCDIIGL